MTEPLLKMRGISKSFGQLQALQDVDLTLNKGEVLGLIGDNGAGKSTLVKILSGAYRRDKGEIFIHGEEVSIKEPSDAQMHGIRMVYQDLSLCPNIDSPGNIYMGSEPSKKLGKLLPIIDRNSMRKNAEKAISELGLGIPDLGKPVSTLSGGQQQAVAIARASWGEGEIVIMDEPVSNLGVQETKKVFNLIDRLKEKEEVGIIVIDHSMENIFSVSDRVMVLREGKKVGDMKIEEADPDELTKLMVGTAVAKEAKKARQANE